MLCSELKFTERERADKPAEDKGRKLEHSNRHELQFQSALCSSISYHQTELSCTIKAWWNKASVSLHIWAKRLHLTSDSGICFFTPRQTFLFFLLFAPMQQAPCIKLGDLLYFLLHCKWHWSFMCSRQRGESGEGGCGHLWWDWVFRYMHESVALSICLPPFLACKCCQ